MLCFWVLGEFWAAAAQSHHAGSHHRAQYLFDSAHFDGLFNKGYAENECEASDADKKQHRSAVMRKKPVNE